MKSYQTTNKIIMGALAFLWSSLGQAEIVTAQNATVVGYHLRNLPETTLTAFDVENVLAYPQDQILHQKYADERRDFEKDLEDRLDPRQVQNLYSIIALQHRSIPVEAQMIFVVKDLQARGIKVLAFANDRVGSWGDADVMEDWRLYELNPLGYRFQDSWVQAPRIVFYPVPGQPSQKAGLFKRGVVFMNGASSPRCIPQGGLIRSFLTYMKLMPDQIVFVSDKRDVLEVIQSMVNGMGIHFLGIHYTALSEKDIEPLHEFRSALQWEVLEKEQRWLSDKEADERLRLGID
jgi:hypothetical protein